MNPDPELVAAEVLARAEVTRPPIDPVALAGLWPNLRVRMVDLDGPGYLLDFDGRIGEMLIRESDPPSRRRYTCAHELGHWVLAQHQDIEAPRQKRFAIERWCDRFAAALLMPSRWIVNDLVVSSLSVEVIGTCARRFGVSEQAALLRVSEVAPIDIGVATLSRDAVELRWTTERDEHGRLGWVDPFLLAQRLARSSRPSIRWRMEDIEVQALLTRRRWIIAVSSARAVSKWLRASRTNAIGSSLEAASP